MSADGAKTEFVLPTPNATLGGIVPGADGALWFAEPTANQIGRITPDGVITEYPIPTPESFTVRLASGPDGAVWFAEIRGNNIGRITPAGDIMQGYWNQAEETAYGLCDGWPRTGDLATVDEGNYIYLGDRKKDMILSGGENVYSIEVEGALYAHPAVLEAAAIGVPDPTWGEQVHAVVVLKPGRDAAAEELIAHCRERIAGYKVPRSVEFADALPKSGAGKILKSAREILAGADATSEPTGAASSAE